MLIATVVGARPQFIKAAMVSRFLRAGVGAREILLHTGQHYDINMSKVFFEELEIQAPDYYLGIGSGTHGSQTGRMLEQIEKVLLEVKPDLVLVYGDTNSTLAGALAAVKCHIKVAHVEAGLRSFNRVMPEEINRVLTDHVSKYLFAPTRAAIANLKREGLPGNDIYLVGDVMYDAAVYFSGKAEQKSTILQDLHLNPKQYILATVHRAENTDILKRLRAIIDGLADASDILPVVLPLHPRTRAALTREGMLAAAMAKRIQLIEPVGYLDMVKLEKNARLIATDSGGVQKEAFFYQVPCITLRDETEWGELVELGWNCVVSPQDAAVVLNQIRCFLNARGKEGCPYGDGNASRKIAQVLLAG